MLTKQPFYVGGFYSMEEADKAKQNAYGATGIFVITFMASLYGLHFHSKNQSIIPSEDEMCRPLTPNGMSDYQVELTSSFYRQST